MNSRVVFGVSIPNLNGVIPGMKTVAQVEANIAAADLPALSARECDIVRDIVDNAMDDLL